MKTPKEFKHEYQQNHYRKQREQIDAGELDYWKLTESNRDAIRLQCKAEAERYPKLRWIVKYRDDSDYGDPVTGPKCSFNYTTIYYRRVDPLPVKAFTEEIEKYKEGLTRCVNDKLRLEKDFSQQKNLAKVATERVEELVKENSKINAELREVGSELWETQKELKELEEWTNQERITLLQDIRTLAMRYS